MTRIINLTVTLRMEVESDAEPDAFFSNLNLMFQTGLGERLASNADVVEVVALHDPEGTLTRKPQIEPLLENFDAAASLWGVDDVLEICPNLSKDDALTVLRSITDRSDCYCGIQPHTIADAIEGVLGIDSDTGLPFENNSTMKGNTL